MNRTRPLAPALLLLALLPPAWAARAEAPRAVLTGPRTVPPRAQIFLDARQSVSDQPIRWKVSDPSVAVVPLTPDGGLGRSLGLVFQAPDSGSIVFTIVAKGKPPGESEVDADAATWTVQVEAAPAPAPTPTPTPAPTPAPAPAVVANLRVIFLANWRDAATWDVIQVWNSLPIRQYLKAHAGADGFHYWDWSVDASNQPADWQAMFAAARADRAPLPKMVVFSGAAPVAIVPITTEADVLARLKTYGGP